MAEYIDREAIIKHIEEKLDKLTDMSEMGARITAMESAYNSTLNYIMQVPAVEVEPVKHGHWIEHFRLITWYECSECHKCIDEKYDFIEDIAMLPEYCEHCGAKMDEEEKEKSNCL